MSLSTIVNTNENSREVLSPENICPQVGFRSKADLVQISKASILKTLCLNYTKPPSLKVGRTDIVFLLQKKYAGKLLALVMDTGSLDPHLK